MRIIYQLSLLSFVVLPCSSQQSTNFLWSKGGSTNNWSPGGGNSGGGWSGGNTNGQWWNNNNNGEDEAFLDELVDQFKQRNQILSNSDVSLQTVIDRASSFILDGKQISLEQNNLEAVDILAPGAALYVDRFYTRPASLVYKSKEDPGVRITMDMNSGKLYSAFSQNRVGRANNICKLGQTNNYVSYTSDDLDDEQLKLFTLEEAFPPAEIGGRRKMLRSANLTDIEPTTTRQLQSGCSSFKVIEVSVVVDSLLCREAGSAGEAVSLVQSIIADTSTYYEIPGICAKLKLLDTQVFCDSGNDPIRPMLNRAGTSNICSSSGSLLEQFTAYVAQENIPGDVVHLFHAKDFTQTTTVGCAWMGTLCRGSGYNSGVNEMSFTNTPSSLAKLLAHENGHICGARHTNDRDDIMFGQVCSNCASRFGGSSVSSISSQIAQTTCTETESGGGTPPAPLPRPVPPPVPAPIPRPVPAPVPRPVPAPIQRPVPAPIQRPFPQPVPAPIWRPVARPSPISWGRPTPQFSLPVAPTQCQDSGTFQFIANGQSVRCPFVSGLPDAWQSFVCGYSIVSTSCTKSCGLC